MRNGEIWDIPVTPIQLLKWHHGADLRLVAPRLTPEEREFLAAGDPKRDLGK